MNETNEMTLNPSVQMFSRWSCRRRPKRRYVVVGIANVAHQHADHPVTVVYATEGHPERLWTRTVDEFVHDFRPTDGLDPELRNRIADCLAHECGDGAEAFADRILAVDAAEDCNALTDLEPEVSARVQGMLFYGIKQATLDYARRLVVAEIAPGFSGLEYTTFEDHDGNTRRVDYLNAGDPYTETLLWVDGVLKVSALADVPDTY